MKTTGMLIARAPRHGMRGAITLGWTVLIGVPLACAGSTSGSDAANGGAAGSLMMLPSSAGEAGSVMERPSSAGASGSDGVAGGGASGGIPICQSPSFDENSQLVVCANGFAHRAQPSICGAEPSAGSGGAPADEGQSNAGAGGAFEWGTVCSDDSDCAPGSACVCNPAAYAVQDALIRKGKGICVLATCRTDADCPAHSYCAVGNLNFSGEAVPGFGCLRDDDECTTDRDCDTSDGDICLQERRRTCSPPPI